MPYPSRRKWNAPRKGGVTTLDKPAAPAYIKPMAHPIPPNTQLMFSFGSNTCPRQMRLRCPGAKRVGPLLLTGGRLVFRGVADIARDEGGIVAGAVWRVTDHHVREMDRFEGVPHTYIKRWLELEIGGRAQDCFYYVLKVREGICPPTETYFNTIREGYKAFGLDENLLFAALHESWDTKLLTPWLKARRKRKGFPKLQVALPLTSRSAA